MRRPRCAIGTSPRRITWKGGATCGRSTAPRRSCSLSSCRSIVGARRTRSSASLPPGRGARRMTRCAITGRRSRRPPGQDFEKFWRRSVHNGLIEGTALPPKTVKASGAIPPGSRAAPGQGRARDPFRAGSRRLRRTLREQRLAAGAAQAADEAHVGQRGHDRAGRRPSAWASRTRTSSKSATATGR